MIWRREWDSNPPVLLGKLDVNYTLPTFVPTILESALSKTARRTVSRSSAQPKRSPTAKGGAPA